MTPLFYRWVAALCLICFAGLAQAMAPSTFENKYNARLYGFNIEVTSRLSVRAEHEYELFFGVETLLGRVVETSQFRWNTERDIAIPQVYTYKRTGLGKNRDDELHFDWNTHHLVNAKDGTSWAFDSMQHIQDNLSYQLQLRQDLIEGKLPLIYPIADRKKVKDYQFIVAGEESLDTPLGKVNTVKVCRAQTNDKRETCAWFAKDFQYLLVRLQQEENGSAYTIYISKASLNGKAIAHF